MPITTERECKDSFPDFPITDLQVCAGFKAGGKDACQVSDASKENITKKKKFIITDIYTGRFWRSSDARKEEWSVGRCWSRLLWQRLR